MKIIFSFFLMISLFSGACNSAETKPDTSTPPVTSVVLPSPTAPSAASGNQCQTAKDCKGMVPHFCTACSTGMKGNCAHWSCVQNTCKIATCDIPVPNSQ